MENKSKLAALSDFIRYKYQPNNQSISNRKKICGVGINDADYTTNPLTSRIEHPRCPAYSAWSNMLKRVYDSKVLKKRPTYEDVIVCEEWLIFSNFRKWFIENHVDNYELDKDLLIIGNKIYSPEACIYIPSWLNCFIMDCKAVRGEYQIGVTCDKYNMKYIARCSNTKTKEREYLGYFETENDAHNAWLSRKLEIAYELKSEMDEIDVRIYPNIVDIVKSKT